jgi:hypothetical protein
LALSGEAVAKPFALKASDRDSERQSAANCYSQLATCDEMRQNATDSDRVVGVKGFRMFLQPQFGFA